MKALLVLDMRLLHLNRVRLKTYTVREIHVLQKTLMKEKALTTQKSLI